MPSSNAFRIGGEVLSPPIVPGAGRARLFRAVLFIGVFVLVAGGGLIYDYSRSATYRATSRLSVEPPGVTDDPTKAQFALTEAQSMRRSEYMQRVADRLREPGVDAGVQPTQLERMLQAEAVPQTTIIELTAVGGERNQLAAALAAWMDVYAESRMQTDRSDEAEAVEEARHQAERAEKSVEGKRKEMESFRRQHAITSLEREENPAAARLKGLHAALNDVATKEVNAEAKVKALEESVGQGKSVVRAADKAAIASLEMRAVDLREKLKDLEHDFTAQYLAMDPKYRALRANLGRVEQQIEQEKVRSQKAALLEAQEELAGAKRATQRIREQADALKQEAQGFSMRFVELRRMGVELEQLQEARKLALDAVNKLQSARKPAAVKVRILTAPSTDPDPIAPDYTRDAAIALAAGLILALGAVWVMDFLRRDPGRAESDHAVPQPIIQISYPALEQGTSSSPVPELGRATPPRMALGVAPHSGQGLSELSPDDVAAMWRNASPDGRLLLAALFGGIAPEELHQLRWKHVDLEHSSIDVPGGCPRRLPMTEPLRNELTARPGKSPDAPVLGDGLGNPLSEATLDTELACIAHDAGLRRPEQVNARVAQFTYAAYLARQGIRMSELAARLGRMQAAVHSELIRMAPSGQPKPFDKVNLLYPGLPTN